MNCPKLADPASYRGRAVAFKFIVPGKGDWLFVTEADLAQNFTLSASETQRLNQVISALNDQGTVVVIVLVPTRGLMHRDQLLPAQRASYDFESVKKAYVNLRDQITAMGAVVPDLVPLIDGSNESDYFLHRDHHWSPAGARATAGIVAERIRQLPIYRLLSKEIFITEPSINIQTDQSINYVMNFLCGTQTPNPPVTGYQTYPVVDEERALITASAIPEVVLVGTSNSEAGNSRDPLYNFDGYLKQFLNLDVLVFAQGGIGLDGALFDYVHSDEYQAQRPKIVVWEIPLGALNIVGLGDGSRDKQMISAIKGCQPKKNAVGKRSMTAIQLQPGKDIVLYEQPGSELKEPHDEPGKLVFSLSESQLREFNIVTRYNNGSTDTLVIDRSPRISSNRYFVDFDSAKSIRNGGIKSVVLDADDAYDFSTTVDVVLCR